MADILLTNADFVRSVMPVYENVDDKYILSSIREAQELKLKAIIGTTLLKKLKALVAARTLSGAYEDAVSELQYYLAYQTVAMLLPKVQYKITNAGVVTTSDENVSPVDAGTLAQEITRYQYKADALAHDFQAWLLDHQVELPELSQGKCTQIRSHLTDAASCGLWLGGARNPRR